MTVKSNKAGGFASVASTFKQVMRSQRAKDNIKNLLKVNQSDGFDCPGCAWGDNTNDRFQFCENGAKAVTWEATDKKVGPEFFREYSVSQLKKQSDHWLEYQGRLTDPMSYNANTDHYEPISWEQAISIIGTKIRNVEPDQVEFYTSGRASNEASYLYQLFGRVLGTNNFPDCSNMCHEASGVALKDTIGVGKGTVTIDDFDHADVIFVFGQNPGTNHPRMMNSLRKASRGGCKIVSFNNLREVALEKFASPQDPIELLTPAATTISHRYFTPKLGGDFAVVRGMVKHLLDINTKLNDEFIAEHTNGLEAYLTAVSATPWELITQQSGLNQKDIEQAADLFASGKRVITTWAMGITQHKHSVDTIKEITNLHLLFGQIGLPGAGLCPVRGHSNVQGNRTMGINENPSMPFLQALDAEFGISTSKRPGHNVNQALTALSTQQSKVLICLGGNLAAAAPDTHFTIDAIQQAELNVQISTKLNRSHLCVGNDAIILPCLGRTEIDKQSSGEQAITVEDTFSMVHASKGANTPVGPNLKSETAIVAAIANATLGDNIVDWSTLAEDYGQIRNLIEKTIPGFDNFNQQIATPGGFHLVNSAANYHWQTHSGKANFTASQLPTSLYPAAVVAIIEKQKAPIFTLQSLRSHDQYNTTIYGMDDRYRGVFGERNVVFINKKDASRLKLEEGTWVSLTSIWHDNQTRMVDGFKLIFYDIPLGNVAAYYPETNPLVPIDSFGDGSFTPTSKSIPVIISASKTVLMKTS
ncbi:FdhF/YdeP family oxidoreductase [Psychrosphaera sp. 1_MG-2023]|uniref:FdhF/YdeP family oxidoreductase n=1 Tax=Psychrosphaera sp. 1_MG-2023 TaxID=3062643 RepID=UPI0026E180DA|nr:FdhF/YdeP family oxidoreductase [Psychrosphaera sp. 1_MG-2023]MDO6719384.1 FdhF/YdeP family oxidoreductase [Psychrosphaera sp. 1_MG-2023]